MDTYKGIGIMLTYNCFLFLCVFTTVSASIDLNPLEVTSCPKHHDDDQNTHDHSCYEMVKKNVSCFNSNFIFTNHHGNHHHGNNGTGLQFLYDSDYFGRLMNLLDNLDKFGSGLTNRNCTVNTCTRKCCSGWAKDRNGKCSQKIKHCENGGVEISKGVCVCPRHFAGQYCDIAVCQDECLNGGTCIKQTESGNQCNCPEPYIGPRCENVNCTLKCENGGQCVVTGFETVCICREGFYGKTCSYSLDNTNCPLPYNSPCDDHQIRHDACMTSGNCSGDRICCNDGCCNKCVEKVDTPCHYEGTVYRAGETFRSEKCSVCTCYMSGIVSCTKITCPEPKPCRSSSSVMSKDTCCPTCGSNDTSLPPNYQPPILRNCLKYGILNVPSWSDTAYVTGFGIQAYDYENKALHIHYSPLKMEHCKCSMDDRVPHPVVASASDRFGRRSECQFPVLVLDQTPPSFVTCPTDIFALETEKIMWAKPDVRDNVGVRFLNLYPPGRGNGGLFPVGNHTMTYTAIDYDGNREFCQFTIFIYDKDTDLSQVPEGLARRQQEQSIQIIAGCIAVVFLAFAVILLLCFARRWRMRRSSTEQRRRDQRIPAVSNGGYGDFSGVCRAASIKPPPYSPPTPPPAYEELAANAGSSDNDMPPRYEEVDSHATIMTMHAYDNPVTDVVARQHHSSEAAENDPEQISHRSNDLHEEQRQSNNLRPMRSVQTVHRGGRSETIV